MNLFEAKKLLKERGYKLIKESVGEQQYVCYGIYGDRAHTDPETANIYAVTSDKNELIELSLQGARNCISIGKGVIRALGKPSHVSLKISDNNDSISVFPCDEDDVMSFRVPAKLFSDHKCVMRINSKRFVHGIMKSNDLDISRTYTLSGEYLQNKNTAVFSLVDGVTLRTIKETD